MKKYLFLSFALLLSSCANTTPEALMEEQKDDVQVVNSALNYEQAYEIVSEHYKGCGRNAVNATQYEVISNLNQERQVGYVMHTMQSPLLSKKYIVVIEIKPSASGSVINIYSRHNMLSPDIPKWINKWLNGESGCWM